MGLDDRRPAGASDAAVEAAGKVSEALETIERARGHLYSFHQLTGRADLQLDSAVALLRENGHAQLADHISHHLIGRNVLPGRWSFQVIEDYDDGYYRCFQEVERLVRTQLTGGRRHVFEAEMKERRRTSGHPAHTAAPNDDRTGE
ncbi:hypothetical protein BST27_15475 [Mycobacterium intermedium]|uniref:Uncharacterized protein n=1 Tax=Mycobacterium intermedium TaxID=28445 RepID=A0A1E3S8C5_MYCIE|nr:hypothetical protein [Mycobacterium intermedium]MCV6964175.1 hypothetical protein [Mycobacterium intermedium]ODQ98321.1 hypothetical protein BHQ20_22765 [Mycobacterium intermedium]OPE47732.1 hypothetical protein BV508_21035 [Mycobacterium intermedium]ORB03356.1 hypothetical protein BST27_15475 [Mycobacterium intermedium]